MKTIIITVFLIIIIIAFVIYAAIYVVKHWNGLDSEYRYESGSHRMTKDEVTVLNLVNRYRFKGGLRTLRVDIAIQELAIKRARAMAYDGKCTKRAYSKIVNDLIRNRAVSVSENVAATKVLPKDVVKKWIESETHCYIIEGNYLFTGIGVAYGIGGKAYYCQIFAR